jgi:hypothetical protein
MDTALLGTADAQCQATYEPWIPESPAGGHTWRCTRKQHDERESLHLAEDGFSW